MPVEEVTEYQVRAMVREVLLFNSLADLEDRLVELILRLLDK